MSLTLRDVQTASSKTLVAEPCVALNITGVTDTYRPDAGAGPQTPVATAALVRSTVRGNHVRRGSVMRLGRGSALRLQMCEIANNTSTEGDVAAVSPISPVRRCLPVALLLRATPASLRQS